MEKTQDSHNNVTHRLKDKKTYPMFYIYVGSAAINIVSKVDILPWDTVLLPDGREYVLDVNYDLDGVKKPSNYYKGFWYYEFVAKRIK